jgi:hypothetical protein
MNRLLINFTYPIWLYCYVFLNVFLTFSFKLAKFSFLIWLSLVSFSFKLSEQLTPVIIQLNLTRDPYIVYKCIPTDDNLAMQAIWFAAFQYKNFMPLRTIRCSRKSAEYYSTRVLVCWLVILVKCKLNEVNESRVKIRFWISFKMSARYFGTSEMLRVILTFHFLLHRASITLT